jgi:type III secretory pathway component EscS
MVVIELILSVVGGFLISLSRILGEYVVEIDYFEDSKLTTNGYSDVLSGMKRERKRDILLFGISVVVSTLGWGFLLYFDNHKHSLIGITIPLVTTISQIQDLVKCLEDKKICSEFFQLLIWVPWVAYTVIKYELLFTFGFAFIFLGNVIANLLRESPNIYQRLMKRLVPFFIKSNEMIENSNYKRVHLVTIFHPAFHFQLFGYVLIAISNNI